MRDGEGEHEALGRLVAAGTPEHQARELASDLAKLAHSLCRARVRLSWEKEPATTYRPDRR